MSLRDDERSQAIQIGAVLLFGILIIFLALYQAFVVPNQNRGVEANHLDEITADMQELRNAIVSIPSTATDVAVTLKLGTNYPARAVAINPGAPTGAIRTGGTADATLNVTVANAVATHHEADDRWTGTNRSFNSGTLSYRANYNEFRNEPTITYDNTLLYHRFRATNLTRAGQRLVDGTRLTLVALNGSLDTTQSSATSVDVRAVSASSRRITITNETNENVTIRFASTLNASRWRSELEDTDELVAQGGHVVDVRGRAIPGTEYREIAVELEGDVTYSLGMAKVGVGTRVTGEDEAYLTELGPDAVSIEEGTDKTLTVEVRDAFNNPVSGVTVSASDPEGSLASSTATTDSDGQATFDYQSSNVDGTSPTYQVNFSYLGPPGGGFAPGASENASVNLTVENTDGSGLGGVGGGGAYTLSWTDPSGLAGVSCSPNVDGTCTADVSTSGYIDLRSKTSPIVEDISIDFGVNDSSIAGLNRSSALTNVDGETAVELQPEQDGSVQVFAASGGSSDGIEFVFNNLPNCGELSTDFESGNVGSEPFTAIGNDAGVNTDVSNSGSRSAFVQYQGILESDSLNTSACGSVQLDAWIKIGDDAYSETPDNNDYLYIEYQRQNGNWRRIERYNPRNWNSQEERSVSFSVTNPNAFHSDFKIRFRADADYPPGDYWHIDDVTIDAVP